MAKKKCNPMGRYVIHSNHACLPVEANVMQYIAFDPGEHNFDIRVERRYKSQLGDCCSRIKTVKQSREQIVYQRIRKGTGSKSVSTQMVFDVLNKYSKYLDNTHVCLIERQMEDNRPMMHLQHAIISYFLLMRPDIVVLEISSQLKTKNLGATKMNYAARKKWGYNTAIEIAEARNDKKFFKHLASLKKHGYKADDSTDNYIQIEAACVEFKYQLTDMGDD